MNLSFALALGLFLGVRHATDADHVAAVGAMLRSEGGVRGAIRTGALWGLGHSATVIAVGVAVAAFHFDFSPAIVRGMEYVVAAMLIGLGAANLRSIHHERQPHRTHHATRSGTARPIAVGLVHGMAGSAGVAILALSTIRSTMGALAYLALFGLGTIVGMIAITLVLALPFALTATRSRRMYTWLVVLASVASIVTGCIVGVAALRA